MKALVGAFNQEKALLGAFSVIVQPVVEPMDRFTALLVTLQVGDITRYLVPRGYTLAVTLEIADATLGGLAFGVGMTTYSHKVSYGDL